MFLKDKIPVLGLFLIFSATMVMAGGPDVTVAPKKEEKAVKAAKAEEQKSPKKIAKTVKDTGTEVMERKAEVRQHSVGEAAIEFRLAAKHEGPVRKVNILFESNPTNAELIINGLYVGSTPVQVPLHRGVHNVKIISTDHETWERQVKAYKGLRVYAVLAEMAEQVKQ